MARRMERAVLRGLTEVLTSASLRKIIFRDRVPTTGLMVECLLALGSTTRWKVMVPSLGQMAENMKATTLTIKKKDKERSIGLTAGNTKEAGRTESSTESDITHQQVEKLSKENGMKVRDYTG